MQATKDPGEERGDPADIDKVVGANIRGLRAEVGYTQRELANELAARGWQVGATAIAKIEAGTRSLRAREIFLIADAIGASPAALFRDDDQDAARRELIDSYRLATHEFQTALEEFSDARKRIVERAESLGYELEVPRDSFAADVLRMLAIQETLSKEPTNSEHTPDDLSGMLVYPDKRAPELADLYEAIQDEQQDTTPERNDGEHPEAPER